MSSVQKIPSPREVTHAAASGHAQLFSKQGVPERCSSYTAAAGRNNSSSPSNQLARSGGQNCETSPPTVSDEVLENSSLWVSTHTPPRFEGPHYWDHHTTTNLPPPVALNPPTRVNCYAIRVTSLDTAYVGEPRNNRNDQSFEFRIIDHHKSFTQEPSYNSDLLDCAAEVQPITHDSIFDLPDVRARFVDCNLTGGSYWHKETSSITDGVAEIRSTVRSVLARADEVGLSPGN